MTSEMIMTCGASGLAVILILIANWMIFKKAGIAGWKSLIPVYNVYKLYSICWNGWMGILFLVLGSVLGVLVSAHVSAMILAIPAVLLMLIQFIFCYRLAKAFGRGLFMGLVLLFTAGLGRMILGFGSSQYVGNPA